MHIYVHWPFCKKKCPYCNFNTYEITEKFDKNWLAPYIKEIKMHKKVFAKKTINSIFFGGGTPTTMDPKLAHSVLNELNKYANFANDIEITMEANPTSTERSKLKEFKKAGVNRVSIGVQSFNKENLKFLGREHSVQDSIQTITLVDSIFNNYSFDLIYSMPNQSLKNWEKELLQAIKYAKYHISCYQLTIEKGTKFFNLYKNNIFQLPKEDLSAKLYNLTRKILTLNDVQQYEVSNYAKKGFESKHNTAYWKLKDYLGIGPGAHSRYNNEKDTIYTINFYLPEKWKAFIEKGTPPLQSKKTLSKEENLTDKITMGLRMKEGIPKKLLKTSQAIEKLTKLGLIQNGNRIRATNKGILVLNSIIQELLLSQS